MMKNRDFLKIADHSPEEIEMLVELSAKLKKDKAEGCERKVLSGKNIVLLFEKDSTRTRCAFEVAAHDQGASVTYIGSTGSQMGGKESIADTARVLSGMYDGIEYRGYGQEIVHELARFADVPVWNGLTDEAHPTQAIADLLTMREQSGKPFRNIKLAYLGDARNNVASSLMVASAKMGIDFRAVSPGKYSPREFCLNVCAEICTRTGGTITVTDDIREGVLGCDFIYTDVWLSMGEPEGLWGERIRELLPYRVCSGVMEMTGNKQVKFMHCLPAFHDASTVTGRRIYEDFGIESLEVTNEVFESPASVVFSQAANRMHSIKAIMVATIHGEY